METEEIIGKNIRIQKGLLQRLYQTEDLNLIIPIKRLEEELALVLAGFKCEKCCKESELTFHHMIMRINKLFTNHIKYLCQRHFFGSIIVLCRDCHASLHENKHPEEMGVISEKLIAKIKKRYKWRTE